MVMEYRSVIYNAARDGNIRRLKVFLDSKNEEELATLLSACTFGTPPLVIACRNGHLEVVKYLVEKTADIEQPGFVVFDGETIEGAPPLWCASAAGHYEIVKFLVECGVDVNHATATNSTPLRAACFDGHLEIVKCLVEHNADIEIANRHGHTCLMIACYRGHYEVVRYLLEHGADVNRKSLKGNTALHDSAESGSLEILEILLDSGAKMDVDSHNLTPMLAASSLGHACVVEYLSQHPQCSWQERIDGLQLLGATYVDKKRDLIGALKYWRRALTLKRNAPTGEVISVVNTIPVKAYSNLKEIETLEEIDSLIGDPDKIRMQALLIRERVLGPAHPDTTYYIRYRGAVYADLGNFDRCVELWLYALKMQQNAMEALCPLTLGSFISFAELFSFMLNENLPHRGRGLRFDDIFNVLIMAVDELKRPPNDLEQTIHDDKDRDGMHRLCLIILHLICLLRRIDSRLCDEEEEKLKRLVYDVVHLDPRGQNNASLLHLACNAESTSLGRYPVCRFPALNVVETLLQVGAEPNAVDHQGDTALHVILSNKVQRRSIVKCMLERGCHIDLRDKQGGTPMDLIKKSEVAVPIMSYVNLMCLAARAIRQHNISFRGKIPARLVAFVEIH